MDCDVRDAESLKRIVCCPRVSLEAEPGIADPHGHACATAIAAVTTMPKPVVT
jgi:hypothetical protein